MLIFISNLLHIFCRELIAGQKEHKRKLHKLSQKQSHLEWEETELGRIHIKIKALMALQKAQQLKSLREKAKKFSKEEKAEESKDVG